MSFAREGLGQGGVLSDVARELTVSAESRRRWLVHDPAPFRAVDMVDGGTSPTLDRHGLVIRTARGHRLEGLDLASAVAVLRALEAAA